MSPPKQPGPDLLVEVPAGPGWQLAHRGSCLAVRAAPCYSSPLQVRLLARHPGRFVLLAWEVAGEPAASVSTRKETLLLVSLPWDTHSACSLLHSLTYRPTTLPSPITKQGSQSVLPPSSDPLRVVTGRPTDRFVLETLEARIFLALRCSNTVFVLMLGNVWLILLLPIGADGALAWLLLLLLHRLFRKDGCKLEH